MYLAPAGGPYDGVARLVLNFSFGTFGCSGALLNTGRHILTAGHCVTDFFGAELPNSASATFITASGTTSVAAAAYHVFSGWDGQLFSGTDIAIIELAGLAPADANRYDIYTNTNEVGQVGNLVGFGIAGAGATGPLLGFGTRRHGQNIYDVAGDFFFGVSAAILLGDFDNGSVANDAIFFGGGPLQFGLGVNEVNIASGDSGGPTFLGGRIAGVHSFGAAWDDQAGNIACPPDVITPANLHGPAGCKLDSSFGELFGDTRVSAFASFINDTIIPEPSTYFTVAIGLSGILLWARRRKPA